MKTLITDQPNRLVSHNKQILSSTVPGPIPSETVAPIRLQSFFYFWANMVSVQTWGGREEEEKKKKSLTSL